MGHIFAHKLLMQIFAYITIFLDFIAPPPPRSTGSGSSESKYSGSGSGTFRHMENRTRNRNPVIHDRFGSESTIMSSVISEGGRPESDDDSIA